MRKLNLIFGLALFLAFLLTGYYMREHFTPAHFTDLTRRMQIRSNHIYMLFISLLSIVSFRIHFSQAIARSAVLELAFRSLIIISGLLSVPAFLFEHVGDLERRIWTFYSVLFAVIAVGVFLLNEGIHWNKQRTK